MTAYNGGEWASAAPRDACCRNRHGFAGLVQGTVSVEGRWISSSARRSSRRRRTSSRNNRCPRRASPATDLRSACAAATANIFR